MWFCVNNQDVGLEAAMSEVARKITGAKLYTEIADLYRNI